LRKLIPFACLALVLPAMAQANENRSFIGAALLYTPSRVDGCSVFVQRAWAQDGQVNVTMRNSGASALDFTLSGDLAGNGLRVFGTASFPMRPGQEVQVGLMRAHAGSLANSVLTLRAAACALRPG
jgi:hypothetical protein